MIRNLARAERPLQAKAPKRSRVNALKCTFTPQISYIGVRLVFHKLVKKLRCELGEDFLKNDKLVVAHPARRSFFRDHYAYNFPNTDESQSARHRVRYGGQSSSR